MIPHQDLNTKIDIGYTNINLAEVIHLADSTDQRTAYYTTDILAMFKQGCKSSLKPQLIN